MENETVFAVDKFVKTAAGDAIRLLPFGPLVKGGKRREITPEYAAKFKLPHFSPPIKLGSHDDATPGGGVITALEVRDDGLYGIPALTERGQQVVAEGHFKYQSPEILWENGGFEDPETGKAITGPMIVGTALLHTPHLGERAAVYCVEIREELSMSEENNGLGGQNQTVTVPANVFEKLMAAVFGGNNVRGGMAQKGGANAADPTEGNNGGDNIDRLSAVQAERDNFAAEVARLKAERERNETVSALAVQLKDADKFGAVFADDGAANTAAGVLAGMTQEQRDFVLQHFSGLAKQVKTSALFAEAGSGGEGVGASGENPVEVLNKVALATSRERKIDYMSALDVLKVERPELFEAAYPAK